jgi:hypothetical protein
MLALLFSLSGALAPVQLAGTTYDSRQEASGALVEFTNDVFADCIMTSYSVQYGGALCVRDGSCDLAISICSFLRCGSHDSYLNIYGAAIYVTVRTATLFHFVASSCFGYVSICWVKASGSILAQNSLATDSDLRAGETFYFSHDQSNQDTQVEALNSTYNTAAAEASAIYVDWHSGGFLEYCVFTNNAAQSGVLALYQDDGYVLSAICCLIADNTVTGPYSYQSFLAVRYMFFFYRCIFYGNTYSLLTSGDYRWAAHVEFHDCLIDRELEGVTYGTMLFWLNEIRSLPITRDLGLCPTASRSVSAPPSQSPRPTPSIKVSSTPTASISATPAFANSVALAASAEPAQSAKFKSSDQIAPSNPQVATHLVASRPFDPSARPAPSAPHKPSNPAQNSEDFPHSDSPKSSTAFAPSTANDPTNPVPNSGDFQNSDSPKSSTAFAPSAANEPTKPVPNSDSPKPSAAFSPSAPHQPSNELQNSAAFHGSPRLLAISAFFAASPRPARSAPLSPSSSPNRSPQLALSAAFAASHPPAPSAPFCPSAAPSPTRQPPLSAVFAASQHPARSAGFPHSRPFPASHVLPRSAQPVSKPFPNSCSFTATPGFRSSVSLARTPAFDGSRGFAQTLAQLESRGLGASGGFDASGGFANSRDLDASLGFDVSLHFPGTRAFDGSGRFPASRAPVSHRFAPSAYWAASGSLGDSDRPGDSAGLDATAAFEVSAELAESPTYRASRPLAGSGAFSGTAGLPVDRPSSAGTQTMLLGAGAAGGLLILVGLIVVVLTLVKKRRTDALDDDANRDLDTDLVESAMTTTGMEEELAQMEFWNPESIVVDTQDDLYGTTIE